MVVLVVLVIHPHQEVEQEDLVFKLLLLGLHLLQLVLVH